MSIKFFGILTHQGAARLANAAALGTKLDLSTMAVGDGGGSLPFPEPTQTALKGERRRAALNQLSIDPLNGNQIIAEQVIPENEGGWWIREIGLFDKDGTLIAVANCPESYKPQMREGSGRTQTIRMILIVNSSEALALKIDPSIVLATRKYVDDGVIEVKAYADTLMATHIAHADPHPQYAPKASPVFTGAPKAPTAKTSDNSTQLATTAFVQARVEALTLPAASLTQTGIVQLSSATDSDSETMAATPKAVKAIAAQTLAKDQNGADIPDKQRFLRNLDLADIAMAGICEGVFLGNGYISIPAIIKSEKKTLYIQWGNRGTERNGSVTINFPVAFPEMPLIGFVSNGAESTPAGFGGIGKMTKSSAVITSSKPSGGASGAGVSYNYLVIGY